MRRWLGPVILLVVVAGAVLWMSRDDATFEGPGFDRPAVLQVENVLSRRGVEAAEAEMRTLAPDLSEPARLYLESALHLRAGRFEEARVAAAAARREHLFAWRPLQAEYAALRNLGRMDEAGSLVDLALENRPFDERVLVLGAEHQLALPEPGAERALEYLDRAKNLSERAAPPGDPTAVDEERLFLLHCRTSLAAGKRLSALDAARQGVRRFPRNPLFRLHLGEAARLSGRMDEAISAYRAAIDLAPDEPVVRLWHEHLAQLLIAGNADAGVLLDETAKMMERWGDARSVRVLRARALVRAERFDEAANVYEALFEEDPYDPTVLRNLAILYYDWKQGGQDGTYLDKSHDLLRRYVRLGGAIDATIRDTWAALTARAEDGGAAGEGLTALRAAWEARPGDADALGTYVDALRLGGHAEEAGSVVRQSLESAGGDTAVTLVAAQWFLDEGPDYDPQQAALLVDAAARRLELTGDLPEAVRWTRCRARLAARRYDDAHADALVLVAARQTGPYLRLHAAAARGLRRFREAEQAYRDALALEPGRKAWRAELLDMLLDGVAEGAVPAEGTLEMVQDEVLTHLDADGGPPALRVVRAATLAMRDTTRDSGVARLEQLLALPEHAKDAVLLKHYARAALAMNETEDVLEWFEKFVAAGGRITPELALLRRAALER